MHIKIDINRKKTYQAYLIPSTMKYKLLPFPQAT